MAPDAQDAFRFSRQTPLIGEGGQERLGNARVLIAGMGGLGSLIASYLGLSGIGFLRIVDFDRVDDSNLNRQMLARPADVGREKAAVAAEGLAAACPTCTIEPVHGFIDDETAPGLISDVDIIVDALDNYPGRHVLNRAALRYGIPLVHGAVRGLYGQALTIIPGRGACLKCIFADEFPRETFPILGPTCGVIGSVQAGEVIKYITGMGALLANRLLVWNGILSEAEIIEVQRSPRCPVCSRGRGGPA